MQTTSEPAGRSKKAKQMERHEAFIQSNSVFFLALSIFICALLTLFPFPELGPSTRHFSKSHERRMKRKAKEQLAGNMDDLQTALAVLDEDTVPPESNSMEKPSTFPMHSGEVKPKAKSSVGKIGKGTSSTLSKAQRKRLL